MSMNNRLDSAYISSDEQQVMLFLSVFQRRSSSFDFVVDLNLLPLDKHTLNTSRTAKTLSKKIQVVQHILTSTRKASQLSSVHDLPQQPQHFTNCDCRTSRRHAPTVVQAQAS